jgi:hypothetical protein
MVASINEFGFKIPILARTPGVHAAEVAATLESAAFRIRTQIIWAKQHFALRRGDYHWQHEPCWYSVREGKPSRWRSAAPSPC